MGLTATSLQSDRGQLDNAALGTSAHSLIESSLKPVASNRSEADITGGPPGALSVPAPGFDRKKAGIDSHKSAISSFSSPQ
jgi:hypothetical protein